MSNYIWIVVDCIDTFYLVCPFCDGVNLSGKFYSNCPDCGASMVEEEND